ncbi:MAG: beta-ketoacyl synthase [Acidimicrobiia bacterium]
MRVAITGMGAVCPIGVSAADLADGLLEGRCGIRQSPWADPDDPTPDFYGAVDDRFDPADWMDAKVIEGCDPFAWFSIAASEQALTQAGLLGGLDPLRTAVVHGTSMGGLMSLMQAQWAYDHHGVDAVSPKTMIKIWSNMAASQICMRHQLHGPSLTVSTACASSLDALGTAARYLEAGVCDVALVGGTEGGYPTAGYRPEGRFEPATHMAGRGYGMSTPSPDPRRAMLPFAADRSGIVSGDGSVWFVLEREAHATGRGAEVLAWLRGHGSLSDSHHPSSPEPNGVWEARAMELALTDAELAPGDVQALVAHATGTPKGDTAEIRAINRVFVDGPGRDELVVTACKGHTGHTGASAGGVNLVAIIDAMHRGRLTNIGGTTTPDPEIRFDVALHEPRAMDLEVAQINAFGFGGQNASIVVTRH